MNNNPLILQQLLQNFRNQQQVQPQQLDPRVALQNNLDNRLALGAGEITPEEWAIHENNRRYDIQHHPIRGRLREYDDHDGSADYFYKSLYQFPFEEVPRLFKQGIEKLKGSPTGGAAPLGQYGMGNIDLYNRPIIKNPDGSISTVRSMSFNDGRNEVLIPTVSPTGIMTPQEAINRYRQTGEYLGKFNTPEEANEYAKRLHEEQANLYNNGTPTGFAVPVQYNQMTPIQQGMQYNAASFDNPNLASSGMTPADIDKLRVMQGRDPMSFEMRERLINAMRDRGYKY